MPRFEPFHGLRYQPSPATPLEDVVCPPYDVISADDRAALVGRSPWNIVRLELPVDGEPDPYTAAGALLDAWRADGVLRRDPVPGFYGYRMDFTGVTGTPRATVGVIGALALEPPGRGILPHEETTPKARSDRLQLLRATRANLSPIWALTPATGLAGLCQPPPGGATTSGSTTSGSTASGSTASGSTASGSTASGGTVTDGDGVAHSIWPITEPDRVAAIAAHVASEPVLVADGHHRYETALAFATEDGGAGSDAVMALVVELDDAQLSVQAIHRLIAGVTEDEVLGALDRAFDLSPAPGPDAGTLAAMERAGALAVVGATGTWLAAPMAATVARATHDLDSSRLDVALAALPGAEVTFQHGWDLAAAEVAAGRATAAVLLRPATVAQIAAISRGGVRMPPKTTFFWPKPRTGMVVRELSAQAATATG